MRFYVKMTVLFLIILICAYSYVNGCEVDDVAVYKVTLHTLWNEEQFPKDYPQNRPKAQWSIVYGQSHNSSYALYHIGDVAKGSVRTFAQLGKLDKLVEEGDDDPKVYDQFSAPPIGTGVGKTSNMVFVDGAHSFISLISRIIPSPDWFVGVDSLNLCVDSAWIEQITLDLEPLDAGAASGLTFTAPKWETSPPGPVTKHGPRQPNHPAAGFYYPTLRELPTIAKVEFQKVKEYSTKELNDLARRELITKLKKKDAIRDFSKRPINKRVEYGEKREEIATKNYLDTLKDLEEDPVGTPRPNIPDNYIEVVRRPHTTTTTTTESEFGSELENMDDVVLAVARGKKMGLGKHLPRHFRSRLHHAVNKIQPNDCLVSAWSEWSPCSTTCGFGEKFRTRAVVRQKRANGRDCPRKMRDFKHCNLAECTHVDYFEW